MNWSIVALVAPWLVGCSANKPADKQGTSDGDTATTPTIPPRWIDVVAGDFASCGLDADGSVECWGSKDLVANTPDLSGQQRLVMAWTGVAALGSDNMISRWSSNWVYADTFGAAEDMGFGPKGFAYVTPEGAGECVDDCLFDIIDGAGGFLDVPDTYYPFVGCAVRDDRSLVCVDEWTGDPLSAPAGSYTQVACMDYECCALSTDGDIVCGMYDIDTKGRLGTVWLPAVIAGPWTFIAAEDNSLCALDSLGEISCFFASDTNARALESPPAGPFIDLDVGRYHACALGADGEISCWGRDSLGETVVPD